MRTTKRRPIATPLLLVGAMVLFAGCGDEGAHLPAGMSGASASYAEGATGVDVIDDVLGGDPGPADAGVSTMVDDPVLTGYDGLDSVDGYSLDDPYSQAVADWNDSEGSVGGLSTLDLDAGMDDDFLPAEYGRAGGLGAGWDDGLYGYGSGVLGAAGYGGVGMMDGGLMDAGMLDAGLDDPGLMDAGFDPGLDPGMVDPGLDAGMMGVGFDPGLVDPGIDPGVIDAGLDAGFVDTGFVDTGFDAGIADIGAVDVGGFDAGIVF